jgi:hypothetical protein
LGDQALDLFTATPVAVSGLPLRIDRDEVLRFQGYKPGIDLPSAEVAAILDEAIAMGEDLMAPCLVYRGEPVTAQGASWIEAGGQRLDIPEIGRLWGRLQAVGAGVCTVGDALEARVRELFDGRELPLAVMLDSVGSAAAESLAEYANDLLCQVGLRAGLKVTNRISPGYAGWDTAGQRALFRLCPGHPIGVALNEACVMTPAKTISWLVGIGPEVLIDHYFTQCRRCWMKDCAYRRAVAATTVSR